MMNPWPLTIVFIVLLGVFVRELWRRTVVRKALSLSPELVRLLTDAEISWLMNGLAAYLLTPQGATLKDDPRIVERVKLLEDIQQQKHDARTRDKRKHALKFAGLPAGPEDAR